MFVRIAAAIVAGCTLIGSCHARASEIGRTPEMLSKAEQAYKFEHPDDARSMEYHFRSLDGHILWCAYYPGGNGGFCKKTTPRMVADTDRAAAEFCKTAEAGDNTPPHAVYGELWDLDYRCARGRMHRLPADVALDREGYVRTQWKSLR
jgi:hypothetical protein